MDTLQLTAHQNNEDNFRDLQTFITCYNHRIKFNKVKDATKNIRIRKACGNVGFLQRFGNALVRLVWLSKLLNVILRSGDAKWVKSTLLQLIRAMQILVLCEIENYCGIKFMSHVIRERVIEHKLSDIKLWKRIEAILLLKGCKYLSWEKKGSPLDIHLPKERIS